MLNVFIFQSSKNTELQQNVVIQIVSISQFFRKAKSLVGIEISNSNCEKYTTNQEEIRSKYLYFSTSSFMELTNLQEIIKTINIFHFLRPKIFRETSFQTWKIFDSRSLVRAAGYWRGCLGSLIGLLEYDFEFNHSLWI